MILRHLSYEGMGIMVCCLHAADIHIQLGEVALLLWTMGNSSGMRLIGRQA